MGGQHINRWPPLVFLPASRYLKEQGVRPLAELEQAISLVAVPLLCGAALSDVTTRRVSNRCSIMVAAVGATSRFAAGSLMVPAVIAASTFVVLLLCWIRGWLGGGDVKLLAASTLLVPAEHVVGMGLAVSLSGGVLAVTYLAGRGFRAWPPAEGSKTPSLFQRVRRIEGWRVRRGAPLPYACAIAAGCIFTIVTG